MKCFVAFLSKEHMDVHCQGERIQIKFKLHSDYTAYTGVQVCTCIGT